MAKEWYCRIAGQELGPFSAAQLRALAADGRLSPGDPLRRGVSGVWVPAASVKGLFDGVEGRMPFRPATGRTQTSDEMHCRPLLRAQPIEEAPAEPGHVASLSRLLDHDDAGIDLASPPPESPPATPQGVKGWRSTGLDFLADEPPPLVRHAEHKPQRTASGATIGPKARSRFPSKARRGQETDPAEPIRRWTLPVLVTILIVLVAVWMVLGRVERFWAVDGQGDRATAAPKTASPKSGLATGATATHGAAPPANPSKPAKTSPKKPPETASKKPADAERGTGFRPPPPDPSGKKDGAVAGPPPGKTPPKNPPSPAKIDGPSLPTPTGQPKTDFGIE